MNLARIVILLALTAIQTTNAADIRVAVVSGDGERAPQAGMADLLMTELSQRPGVVTLEREEVGKALAERKLDAAGLSDRAQAINLSATLGADAFFVLERVRVDSTWRYRVKIIEALSGLMAGDRFFDGSAAEKRPQIMTAALDDTLPWLRTAPEQRRYIALLGFTAEKRGDTLTDLPTALASLVESHLSISTNLLVIDREYLRHLQEEQELTGTERQLALSSYLVEGLLRPATANDDQIDLQIQVRPLHSADGSPLLVQGSVSNVLALAQEAADAILKQIGAAPISSRPLTAAKEAAKLVDHARILQRYGENARALPLLESAYLLDPKPGTALLLASAVRARAFQRAGSIKELPEALKQEIITMLLRAIRIWQVEMDQRIANARGKTVSYLQALDDSSAHVLGSFWRRLRPNNPETDRLYQELRQQKEECRQRELAYSRELWPKHKYGNNTFPGSTGYYCWHYVHREVTDIREMSDDAAQFVAQMKQLMTPWPDMPGYTSPDVMMQLLRFPEYRVLDDRDHLNRFLTQEGIAELLAWCDWVAAQPSLCFRMAGLYYKILIIRMIDREKCMEHIIELINLYAEFLSTYGDNDHVTDIVRGSVFTPPKVADRYIMLGKMLDVALTSLDSLSFAYWINANLDRLYTKHMDKDYQVKWFTAAAGKLFDMHAEQHSNMIQKSVITASRKTIEARLAELGHKMPTPTPELSPQWQAYQIETFEMGGARQANEQLRLCKRIGDSLALVWSTPATDNNSQTFRAEVCDLEGKSLRSFPPFTQKADTEPDASVDPRDVTLADKQLFMAAGPAGLLVFSRDDVRLLGAANDLPQVAPSAVATAGDKVIIGFESGYLGAFDQRAGKFEELAYSRSLLKRNPLDGCNEPFRVTAMIAAPDNTSVWFATSEPRAIWHLTTPEKSLKKIGDQTADVLSFDNDTLFTTWVGSTDRYNLTTGKWTKVPNYKEIHYLFDDPNVIFGDDIIRAGTAKGGSMTQSAGTFTFHGERGLYIYSQKSAERKAFHLPLKIGDKPAHIIFLIKTSDRTALAGTEEGAFWRLTQSETATSVENTIDQTN